MYLKYLNKITILELTAYVNTVSGLCQEYPFVNHASFELSLMLFLFLSQFQIYVISLAEPRLPLQLDDAVRPEVEGEEVKTLRPWIPFIVFVIKQKQENQATFLMQWCWGFVRLAYFLYVIQS